MTSNKEIIDNLKSAEWLDENTRALGLQWTVFNDWSNTFYITTIFIENPGNDIFNYDF